MFFDRILMLIEIGLLIWLTAQGEYIRFYEREVYRLHSERENERRAWRLAKQKSQLKKVEISATTELTKEPNRNN